MAIPNREKQKAYQIYDNYPQAKENSANKTLCHLHRKTTKLKTRFVTANLQKTMTTQYCVSQIERQQKMTT